MGIIENAYRLLGLVAPINQRLGRFRLNFIPANVLLTFGLGVLAFVSWTTVAKVIASRKAPEPQTVDALVAKTRFAQGYVAVQGKLMTESRLSLAEKGGPGNLATQDYTWAPLVDAATGDAVLVQFATDHEFPANGAQVTVEGILRPMNSLVARQLKESNYVHAGIPIDRRLMLLAGRQPGSLVGPLISGTAFAVLAVALMCSMLTRNVIFMPEDAAQSGAHAALLDTASGGLLLVSGTLARDAKTRRFFTNMPAVMQRLDTGDPALLSHITTSSTFFGVKTQEQSGVWMLVMRAGSITDVQTGYLFWGLQKMRATRFHYVNAMSGASERAVVAIPAQGAVAGSLAA